MWGCCLHVYLDTTCVPGICGCQKTVLESLGPELQGVVKHHEDVGDWTQVLSKGRQPALTTAEPSLQPRKNSVKRTIPNLFHKIFFKGRDSVGKVMCAKIILTKNNSQQNLTLPSTGKAKLSPKILRWASINMSFGEHFYEMVPFYMARAGFKTKILCLSFLSAGITGVHYCDQVYEHNLPR